MTKYICYKFPSKYSLLVYIVLFNLKIITLILAESANRMCKIKVNLTQNFR